MKIFENADALSRGFAGQLADFALAAAAKKQKVNVALSGGSTPKRAFKLLAGRKDINWNYVNFFWGDERCVPPGDPESNYGAADELFLSKISIPPENIHRARGEDNPEKEIIRYSKEIAENVRPGEFKIPVFDWVILGLGADGHTASVFPGAKLTTDEDNICGIAEHPQTGQKRISLTLPVINNAERVSFLVSGGDKAKAVDEIINKKPQSNKYPAAQIAPAKCAVEWFVDKEALRVV
jgi:6-phosphogluconolactonase